MMLFPHPFIWVESPIGGGKTTFCREVGTRNGYRCLYEPVDTNEYLPDFYAELLKGTKPNPHAFSMQMELLGVRADLQGMGALETSGLGGFKGAISDRSPAGDRVFCKMLVQSGDISPRQWRTYHKHYLRVCRQLLPPTKLIYLDCPPEICYERIQRRGRECEKGITLDYLKALCEAYDDLLLEAKRGLLPWGHAIEIETFHWGRIVQGDELPDWDEIASSVRRICRPTDLPLVPPLGPSGHVG